MRTLRRRSGDGQSASGASSCYIRPGENTARAPRVEPPRPPENEPGESHAAPAVSPPSGPLTFIARNIHGRVLQCIHWKLFQIHALFQEILYTFNKERFMFD